MSSLTYDKLFELLSSTELDEEFDTTFHEKHGPHIRNEGELFWVGLQPFLLGRGYRLRPRYQPDWKPSWDVGSEQYQFREDKLKSVSGVFMHHNRC